MEIWRRGHGYLSPLAQAACRVPPGHPEAYIESFGNIYLGATASIRACDSGKPRPEHALDHPDVEDGVMGMAFIETVIESGRSGRKWTQFKKY